MMTYIDPNISVPTAVSAELKQLYQEHILPLETAYNYEPFREAPLTEADFDAKPLVLWKTSFIKSFIGQDFPTMNIGSQPTTDKFTLVSYGEMEEVLPGSVVISDPGMPFGPLGKFGSGFAHNLRNAVTDAPALRELVFVDTPGVLSGAKHRSRGYRYDEAVEWFAGQASRILLFFEPNKLEVSTELETIISKIKRHKKRIRLVLNKADTLTEPELVRIYGSMMWNMCNIFREPDEMKVFVLSFHKGQDAHEGNNCGPMFERDANDLADDLNAVPNERVVNKMNAVRKRGSNVKLHAKVILEFKRRLPKYFGQKSSQVDLVDHLKDTLRAISNHLGVPFGRISYMQTQRSKNFLLIDQFSKYPKYNRKKFEKLEMVLVQAIPNLLRQLSGNHVNLNTELIRIGAHARDRTGPKTAMRRLQKHELKRMGRSRSGSLTSATSSIGNMSMASIKSNIFTATMRKFRRKTRAGSRYESEATVTGDGFANRSFPRPIRTSSSDNESQRPQRRQIRSKQIRPNKSRVSLVEQRIIDGGMRKSTASASVPSIRRNETMDAEYALLRTLQMEDQSSSSQKSGASKDADEDWVVSKELREESDALFHSQRLVDGKLTGQSALEAFSHYQLSHKALGKIWKLVDTDGDQELDEEQFALAVYFIKRVKAGDKLPKTLMKNEIPPSHRI